MAEKFRSVNPILGARPSIGPIPADLFLPWGVISFVILLLAQNFLHLNWVWTILLIAWGDATWWILTGSKPYKFLSKFMRVPRWTRHSVRYSPIAASQSKEARSSLRSK